MTIDPRRRARELARKAAKRKARLEKKRRETTARGSILNAMLQAGIATWPAHESYMPGNVFELGLGSVVISRRTGSQFAVGVFLVDTGCLGVKDAFLNVLSAGEYEALLNRLPRGQPLVPVKPECARKLIEGAVKYAADLGFEPHQDYHSARSIFGVIDTSLCDTTFQFGQNGKPFYWSGPHESPARRQQILDVLTKRCGPDGFHFLVGIGDPGFDELDDTEVGDSGE
jgi:hypothetical protein